MTLRVYLIASTSMISGPLAGFDQFLAEQSLEWQRPESATGPERLVEAAGRVCYMSFGSRQYQLSTAAYIAHLIKQGHESVLEHANFTVLVAGISRSLSHQIVRHRVGFAYSQLSQQYHDESEAQFVEPGSLSRHPDIRELWRQQIDGSRRAYSELLARMDALDVGREMPLKERQRMRRSIARSILPGATQTTMVITGNVRGWRHVLKVRGSTAGDTEMRNYCVSILRCLRDAAAPFFADFEIVDNDFGESIKWKSQASSAEPPAS
jgi:thymidylate synthase (FAD)